jgi:hypothetical protein
MLAMEMAVGLVVVVGLLMMLGMAVIKERQAEKKLGAVRTSVRGVEAAMAQMHMGKAPPAEARVEPLTDAAPAGYQWIRLTMPASEGVPAATLVGLVPVPGGKLR